MSWKDGRDDASSRRDVYEGKGTCMDWEGCRGKIHA
jgi:hypothetical protein